MLLIRMNEWLGPGKRWPPGETRPEAKERHVSFVSGQELPAALAILRAYQEAYNARYRLAVNFTLLGVDEVPDIAPDLLEFFGVEIAEGLPTTPEGFG